MSESGIVYTDDGDFGLDVEETTFTPCPEGMLNAVCVEVVPPTLRKGFDGSPQAQIRLVFETDQKRDDGSPHYLSTRWMTIKLGDKANLGKLLREWLGDDFPTVEARKSGQWKLKANLEGRSAYLTVEHEEDNEGRTWARIKRVRAGKVEMAPSAGYVRTTDREDAEAPVNVNEELEGTPF